MEGILSMGMHQPIHWRLLCVIVSALLLPGCASAAIPTAVAPAGGATRSTPPPSAQQDLPELVGGNEAFAFGLYQALREEPGNLFYSPYSISAALAMVYAGARGETERQMQETLHFSLAQDRLHPAFNLLDAQLMAVEANEAGSFQLNVANSLWGQEGFPFRDDFLAGLAGHYGAGLRLVNFIEPDDRETARQAINHWVEGETQGKIQELIKQGILTELTRLVLANAIYFKADWVQPFHSTRDEPFTRLDGSQVSVPLMTSRMDALYAAGENFQAIELPYKGERVSMIVLLPAEGQFEAFEETLSLEAVDAILQSLQIRDIKLYLPKFSFSSNLMLAEKLIAMGMPDAFDPTKADLTGMYDPTSSPGAGLHISHVVHQAFVAVDEEGTEAAAATGIIEEIISMPEMMRVDRPFIFLIRDSQTGTILFVGRCLDPSNTE